MADATQGACHEESASKGSHLDDLSSAESPALVLTVALVSKRCCAGLSGCLSGCERSDLPVHTFGPGLGGLVDLPVHAFRPGLGGLVDLPVHAFRSSAVECHVGTSAIVDSIDFVTVSILEANCNDLLTSEVNSYRRLKGMPQ